MSNALKKLQQELEAAKSKKADKPLNIVDKFIPKRKLIGEILVEMGVVSEEEIQKSLKKSKSKNMRLGEILLLDGIVTEVQMAQALAKRYDLDYLNIDEIKIDAETKKYVPEKIARENNLVPINVKNEVLYVAVDDPTKVILSDSLHKSFKLKYKLFVSPVTQILSALDQIYSGGKSLESLADNLNKKRQGFKLDATQTGNEINVEAIIDKIMLHAIRNKASDIHIEPSEHIVRIRERIDGVLHEVATFTSEISAAVISKLKVTANLDIAEKRKAQDGRFQHKIGSSLIDIRLSTLPTIKGEKLVMRILDKSNMKVQLEELGMSKELLANLKKLLLSPHGILLVTGPTGSGKTTTVYSMLNQINDLTVNIVSVEDPIEYQFDIINQVQVNEKAGTNFAGVLRNILRQDPDVIMIGEIRDSETADIAIRAAITGHLVISTLHTNDSISAISRLVDLKIEPFMLSSSLLGVLAQRLVRVLCSSCKEKSTLTEEEISLLDADKDTKLNTSTVIYRPKGCDDCNNLGYKGRTPIFELFSIDEILKKNIAEGKSQSEIVNYAKSKGFITIRSDGIKKILDGITTVEEIIRATI